jgi:hypothetical protein
MPKPSSTLHAQSGGITILVTLMLLVLLTIAAVSMSRNSFREVVISGTTRQGAMTRNLADSGIEWSILYIDPINHPGNTTSSTALQAIASTLLKNQIFGVPYDVSSQAAITTLPNVAAMPADLQMPAGSGNGTNIALTCMGKMPPTGWSQGAGSTGTQNIRTVGNPPPTDPDIWAVRSDAQVTQGPVTFWHSKEAWISTPPRQ